MQGLASVFNITLGIVSWWTSKESERYNRLIQLRVFAFCLNILHAYITGPIIYQNDDVPLMAPGKQFSKVYGLTCFNLPIYPRSLRKMNEMKNMLFVTFCRAQVQIECKANN